MIRAWPGIIRAKKTAPGMAPYKEGVLQRGLPYEECKMKNNHVTDRYDNHVNAGVPCRTKNIF
jgi:hypothetical protein